MTKIIAVTLRKGGSGKTTTAVNIAAGIADKGKNVLLIDLDPQANASIYSGILPHSVDNTINNVFANSIDVKKAIYKTEFNYYIIPSDNDLEHTENGFDSLQIFYLRDLLNSIIKQFDYVIIDTPPSVKALTSNALCMSDYVILPMQTNSLSLYSIEATLNVINTIKKNHNKKLKLLGILPTLYNTRGLISKIVLDEAKKRFDDLIMPITIKYTTAIAESTWAQKPGILYETDDYSGHKELVNYLLNTIEGE